MQHNPEHDLISGEGEIGVVSGEVLKLWMKQPEFLTLYNEYLTTDITCRGNRIPYGYVTIRDSNDKATQQAKPLKKQLILLIIALSKTKFEKRYSLADASRLLTESGLSITRMGLLKRLNKIMGQLGLESCQPKGKNVRIESLADAEVLVQRERAKYAQDAKKQKKSPEEIKSDMDEINQAKRGGRPTQEKKSESKPEDTPEEFVGRKVIYEPTAKQIIFHAASEKIVLYGGAAGGGKSFALLFDVIRYAHVPGYKGLIIRRTMAELTELIETSKEFYPKLFPGCKFNTQKTTWKFPSGASVLFGYLDKPNDKLRYQGQQYQYIAFDELGQWMDATGWHYLKSRLRNPPIDPRTGEKIPTLMRATSNPGASWVKEMFIDAAEPNTTFYDKAGVAHRFIPATLLDNPYLDADYRQMLMSLPEVEKRQLLYGDWNATNLSAFPEFRKEVHVVPDFEIPLWWNRVCALDYGYRDPACALWYAVNPDSGQKVYYREYAEVGRFAPDYAYDIIQLEMGERVPVDHVIDYTVFNKTGHTGPTTGEEIYRAGLRVRPADRNRMGGKNQIHGHLRVDMNTEEPGVVFFESLTGIITQLQAAQIDEKNPDDINQRRITVNDVTHHWDLYDCLRYGLMARPTRQSRQVDLNSIKQNSRWNKVHDYFK